MKLPRDVEVEIYFLLPEEGGRATPAFNKYRPQFYYNNNDWDAQHEYPDTEKVYPGDTVKAYLAFMSPQEHIGKVYEGMEFLIREGARTVGRGTVNSILELEASAKSHAENKDRIVVASDVNLRDGIGVEIYRDNELLIEIFRDDTERTRTVTLFKESISLEQMEKAIETFKKEIPWEFIDYEE